MNVDDVFVYPIICSWHEYYFNSFSETKRKENALMDSKKETSNFLPLTNMMWVATTLTQGTLSYCVLLSNFIEVCK